MEYKFREGEEGVGSEAEKTEGRQKQQTKKDSEEIMEGHRRGWLEKIFERKGRYREMEMNSLKEWWDH